MADDAHHILVETAGERQRLSTLFNRFAIIPFIFICATALYFTSLTTITLMMSRVCLIEQHHPKHVCDHLDVLSDTTIKLSVQNSANNWLMIQNIIQALPAILFSSFIGPWSDKYGRRIGIFVPLVGYILANCCLMLVSLFEQLGPYWIVFTAIPIAMSGSTILIMMVLTYIADTTPHSGRTMKYAFVDGTMIVGMMLGQLVGGYVQKIHGFAIIYLCAMSLQIVGLLYGVIFIKESRGQGNVDSCKQRLKFLFNLSTVRASFAAFIQWRPQKKRTAIILLSFCLPLYIIFSGFSSVLYLYMQLKFDWSEWQFSLFSSISTICMNFSSFIFLAMMKHFFQMHDFTLAIMGCLSFLLSIVVRAIANTPGVFYIGTALGMLMYTISPICRSSISKLLSPEEIGKIFAIISVTESVTPIITSVVYPEIYDWTAHFFASCFMYVAGLFAFLTLLAFLWLSALSIRWQASEGYENVINVNQ